MTEVRVVEEELRFKFIYRGRLSLAYNKGFTGWGDFYLSRPNFYPVYTPCGRQVTISSAYRYNHHRSIFIGHGDVNGTNFFHDNNPTRPNLGDIVLEAADSELSDATGSPNAPSATWRVSRFRAGVAGIYLLRCRQRPPRHGQGPV